MTQATTMTITRALVQLKSIGEKIDKTTNTDVFVTWRTGNKIANSFNTAAEAGTKVVANLQRLDALIRNRQKIKAAIVKSNAETLVTVAGQQMTVAEAIEMKHTVTAQRNLLNTLVRQLSTSKAAVQRVEVEIDAVAQGNVERLFGRETKATDEQVKVARDAAEAGKKPELIDTGKVESEWIPKLEKGIEEIESELDFILSEKNATTTITVSLEAA